MQFKGCVVIILLLCVIIDESIAAERLTLINVERYSKLTKHLQWNKLIYTLSFKETTFRKLNKMKLIIFLLEVVEDSRMILLRVENKCLNRN